jgi:iron-sulfur cluster assembly protein
MLQEVDEQKFELSPAASKAVTDILTERNLEGYALRVYVAGGGCSCSHVNFGMALDNNIREEDITFESDGVKVVVDKVSIDYLRGAEVDFVMDPERGSGFLVKNPNALLQNDAQDEEGCACGGSCSCNN